MHILICVNVIAFFFVVSQETWERTYIIQAHLVLPSHKDIIHLTH